MSTPSDRHSSSEDAPETPGQIPGRQAEISPDDLPDSVDFGEDVSMGAGAVRPGKPGLSREASHEVAPEQHGRR